WGPGQLHIDGARVGSDGMNHEPHLLAHELLITDEPAVLDRQARSLALDVHHEDALELIANPAQGPEVVPLRADLHMRPSPVETAVMHVIGGEIVGKDFAVETVERMN